MFRKLVVLAATPVAGLAFSASAASAQVTVHNPGMFAVSGNQTLALIAHTPQGEVTALQCTHDWEANVDASGHIDLHDVNIDPPGTGPCDTRDDCDDAGWEGQIEEAGPDAFQAHVNFCLEGTNSELDGVPVSAECDIFASEAHCDDVHVATGPSGVEYELDGELATSPAIQLEHG